MKVKNGTLGTVKRLEDDVLWVARSTEQAQKPSLVRVDLAEYPHVEHGYAATIHKSQGTTVDRCFVLASAYFDRHISYVALSRHREGVELYWSDAIFPSFAAMCGRLSQAQHKDTTLDYSVVRNIEPPEQDLLLTQHELAIHQENHAERLKMAQERLNERAQTHELQAGIESLSQQLGQPVSYDWGLHDRGVYQGIQEINGQQFGLMLQDSGYKLVALKLCQELSVGDNVACTLDNHQEIQVVLFEPTEKPKEQGVKAQMQISKEQTEQAISQQSKIQETNIVPKVIKKDLGMDIDL